MQNSNQRLKFSPPSRQGHPDLNSESGQIMVMLLLMLSLFLLAMVAFAVDFTNLWFHRQAAQTAADSACQAAAIDMDGLLGGLTLPNKGFTVGTAGNCSASVGTGTICYYANANGYSGSGLTSGASSSVAWTFPATVTGVTAPPAAITTHPFLNVTVTENVPTYFLYSFKGTSYQQVAATCTCGVVQDKESAPMLVLNPTSAGSFSYSGGGSLTIIDGPVRGVQVNSSSATAITCAPSGIITTSAGGPAGTGSGVGVVGGPTAAPTCSGGGFSGGTTGTWAGAVLPVPDPYAAVAAPTKPATSTTSSLAHVVTYGQDGCPDHSPTNYIATTPHSGCLEFEPGYYPAGITGSVSNFSLKANDVAIFKPGIYYMNGDLNIAGSDDVRLATPCKPSCSPYSLTTWQQTDGVMFYFLKGNFMVSGGSGALSSGRVDSVSSTSLTCDGSTPTASLGMSANLNGNVLVGQCATNGTYWDAYGDTTDSRGSPGSRGLLVYQAHTNVTTSCGGSPQPGFSGSGALAFSGTFYLHSTSYADHLCVTGGASTGTFIIGQIVADNVTLNGSGAVKLALNPSASTQLLKVAILQ